MQPPPTHQEHLAMSGDFNCPNWREGSDGTGMQWVEAWDAVKHPTMHRTAPYNKEIIRLKISIVQRLRNPD